jgi:D-alanyl-D-alanine dipeptidase
LQFLAIFSLFVVMVVVDCYRPKSEVYIYKKGDPKVANHLEDFNEKVTTHASTGGDDDVYEQY